MEREKLLNAGSFAGISFGSSFGSFAFAHLQHAPSLFCNMRRQTWSLGRLEDALKEAA